MTPDRLQEIERRPTPYDLPPAERAAWLDVHATDPALRSEVVSLLASSESEAKAPSRTTR